jgi:hypothetical protein
VETQQHAPPSLDNEYTIIWYEGGALHVRGFKTQDEAMVVYNQIIDQYEALRNRMQRPIRVYLAWILAGYEDDNKR